MSNLPKAIWEGKFNLGSCAIPVVVLDNGQRIVTREGWIKFFEWLYSRPCKETAEEQGMELIKFCEGIGIPDG